MSPLTPWDGGVTSHDHFVIPRDTAGNGWAMMMLLCAKNTGPMKHSLEKLKKENIYCVQGIKLSDGDMPMKESGQYTRLDMIVL